MFGLSIFYLIWFLILVILITFAIGGVLAAPWVPLWKKDIYRMLKLAEIKPDEVVYDLGAGEGRVILVAAKDFQAKATGFEIAILPYLWGCIKIWVNGLQGRARLKYKNFYNQNLSQADVVCTFLSPWAMEKLKPKLKKELKPGSRLVSAAFPVVGWQPQKIDKADDKSTAIYLYQK